MQQDIRKEPQYRDAESLYRQFRQPGSGLIFDAIEAHVASHGMHVVFAGSLAESLEGTPPTRLCLTDLTDGGTRVLTFGPHVDRSPKYSPDGKLIAFLSDRHRPGDFQPYLLDPVSGAARATPRVDGWVEYLQWSPDGRRILLGVAGHGADISGGQGAISSSRTAEAPRWMPTVESGDADYRWRRLWVYELETSRVRAIGDSSINVWEASWCGDQSIATIVSPGPGEGLWYSAHLHLMDLESGRSRVLREPSDQLGCPAGSPSGRHLAFIEAICSDRGFVAGNLRLVDIGSGAVSRVDTAGIDVTYTEWRSDTRLLLAGHRGFETVVGVYDTSSKSLTEVWSSSEVTTGNRYVSVSGIGESGDCVIIGESFLRAPEIATIRGGQYRVVKSFDTGFVQEMHVERVTWRAPGDLEIQGWLLRPSRSGPHPLVMNIHGGPVGHWRQRWLGRAGILSVMLLRRGYAVFFPNPRGSTGRGQDFVRHVRGDMGGADTYDYLSGVDHLVERGIADPKRLGVTGISYGGYMTSWLITQDTRFAAAVPVAPTINMVTQHLVSNIPHFVSLFLADDYANPVGKYSQRSPLMHARKVRTPALIICGALDRCTPPEEAIQFHNALLENGAKSVLVTYPQEGHGIRKLPAAIDYAARLVSWFEEHMPA